MEYNEKLRFHGGMFGAWLPMLIFVVVMLIAALTKHVNLLVFSAGAFAALCVGFFLAKDKKMFDKVVINGVKNEMLAIILLAYLLAGIMSQLLRQSGLISGLVWLSSTFNLNAGFLPVIAFLTCVVVSTSCGTTGGTITAVTPIMLPLAVGLGCDPALTMGAIISGSIFGDNLAPISDTTIASALTQEAEISDVVRTRLPFSLISGAVASVLYIILGTRTTSSVVTAVEATDASKATALVMLLIPVLMVVLMLKGMSLVSTMLLCNVLGIVLNLAFGLVPFSQMIAADGPIAAGMGGMASLIIYCIMLFTVLEITKASGAFESAVSAILSKCNTPTKVECGTCAITILGMLAVAGSAVNIMIIGPFIRQMTKRFKIKRTRGANIADGLSTAVAGILPYNPGFLTGISLALASGVVAADFSFIDVLPYCFHSFGLLILFIGSSITGIGRTYEE